jgi:hypothetical protein
MLSNCIYYDETNFVSNYTSDVCFKVREIYKQMCWGMVEAYLDGIGRTKQELYMAAAAFKEDRTHGPTVAKIFKNMYLVEDVKRFTSSMIKFKTSLKIKLFVED